MTRDFLSDESLWVPEVFVPTSAFGHLPFFFWLISELRPKRVVELGSADGYTFFGFCQAAREFGLEVTAVDTWKGDAHTGPFAESMFQNLKRILQDKFAEVNARTMRMTFDEAVGNFEDGSLDLVFVDGCHSYEAVSSDYRNWLPKLSNRGVMVFHDTTVRTPGFGVYKLWEELMESWAGFNFTHDHGLGVLPVGKDVPESLKALADAEPKVKQKVANLYAGLGQRLTQIWEMKQLQSKLEQKEAEIAGLKRSWSWRLTGPLRTLDAVINRPAK